LKSPQVSSSGLGGLKPAFLLTVKNFPAEMRNVGEQRSWQETLHHNFSNTEQDISKTTLLLLLWRILTSNSPSFLF